MNYVVVLYQNL